MSELPTGTVTFLFTDVEGSTSLLRELGDRYAEVLHEHRATLRRAFERHGGVEVDTQGDAFFVAFPKASEALAAAAEGRDALARGPIRVRMGLHTGEPVVTEEGYVGIDVHRAARIAAAGHGGQILVSQSTRDLGGADSLRDLGRHRLKDLTQAERIYQFGNGEFPPLKSLNQTNLPVQPAPLVGRGRELREVLELLHSHRLVTLTGSGGSGKTRLALQVSAEVVEEYPDGVWFISLATVRDPELVEPTIAQALGARDDLSEFLRGKKLLMLLDNLEQLLPAGAVTLASLDADVLATSRERINVGAEQEYPLPPLPVDDAVALFAQRARQLKPSFEPDQHVTEIARRLDGLPLALELAAARVKVLTAEQILERLGHGLDLLTGGTRDAPQRHRTLRATIAWSYELLTKDERALFRRFAVFAGSFDLDAAERVCDADLDLIGSLVDKSLLRQTDEGRFFMLETIREYAAEQLGGCEEAHERRRRHADYFLSVAEYQATESKDSRSVAFTRLDRDHENFRAALSCFSSTEELERELRLVLALNDFWDVRGHLREGRKHVEAALRHAGEHHPALRVKVLAMASDYARVQGDLSGARAFCEEGLTLAQQIGDLEGVARALHELGEAAVSEEDFERATGLFEQAVIVAGQAGWSGAGSIGNLGDIALARGDYRRAKALSEEALALARAEGREIIALVALSNLASSMLQLGDKEEALSRIRECLDLAEELGFSELICWSLEATAAAVAAERQLEPAARLMGAAAALLESINGSYGPSERRLHAQTLASVTLSLGEEMAERLQAEGRAMEVEQAVELARKFLD